jgi:hypothetical protein
MEIEDRYDADGDPLPLDLSKNLCRIEIDDFREILFARGLRVNPTFLDRKLSDKNVFSVRGLKALYPSLRASGLIMGEPEFLRLVEIQTIFCNVRTGDLPQLSSGAGKGSGIFACFYDFLTKSGLILEKEDFVMLIFITVRDVDFSNLQAVRSAFEVLYDYFSRNGLKASGLKLEEFQRIVRYFLESGKRTGKETLFDFIFEYKMQINSQYGSGAQKNLFRRAFEKI